MCHIFSNPKHKFKLLKIISLLLLLLQTLNTAAIISIESFSTSSAPMLKLDIFTTDTILESSKIYQGNSNSNMAKNIVSVRPLNVLNFTCTAPYLTKWTSSILFSKAEFYVPYPKRLEVKSDSSHTDNDNESEVVFFKNSTFNSINTLYYEMPRASESYIGGFGFVRCESVQNSSLSTEINVYTILPNSCQLPVEQGRFLNLGALTTQRYKVAEGLDLSRQNLHMNPRITIPCKLYCFNVSTTTIPQPKLFTLSRQQSNMNTDAVLGSEINPNLLSYDETIGFTLNYTGNSSYPASFKCVTERDKIEYWVRRKVSTLKPIYVENRQDESGRQSGIICVDTERKADPNEKPLSNAVAMISCNFPYLCDSVKQCFGGGCSEKAVRIIRSGVLPVLAFPFNHGLVRCDGGRDTAYAYLYTFQGINSEKHWLTDSFEGSNKKAIIDFRRIDPIYYTNDTVLLTCEISSFVLISNIKFALSYTFGQGQRQGQPFTTFDTPDNEQSQTEHNPQLAISSKSISIKLTKNMTGIICMAPWFNSTSNWVQTTSTFIVKDIITPRIDKSHGNQNYTFDIGRKHAVLNCIVLASEPLPEIIWTFPKEEVKENVNVIVIPGDKASFLKFTVFNKSFIGKYVCTARNKYGWDSHEFYVGAQESAISSRQITGITLASIAILGIFASFLILWRKYRYAKSQLQSLTEEDIKEFKEGNGTPQSNSEAKVNINMLPFDTKYILNPTDVMIEKGAILGQGQFGIVYRGLMNGVTVAVKTTKPIAEIAYVKALLAELKIMSYIGEHPNIIRFLGAVINKIQESSVQAVVELSPLGNLLSYLRKLGSNKDEFVHVYQHQDVGVVTENRYDLSDYKNDKTTIGELIRYSQQIASGMNFLSCKKVFHGDLAARNVLLFNDNIVKITDFGLSKQLYASANYVKKQKVPLPWRWMALESLRFMEFSIESDVWSFAVTLWEIFTLGETPYSGLGWNMEFVSKVEKGLRLGKPFFCPTEIYDQMLKCWNNSAEKRPSFSELLELFECDLKTYQNSLFTPEQETTDTIHYVQP